MIKCARLISKVKSCYRKVNRFKFSLEVPVRVEDALIPDKQNGNNLWQDAINKETNNSHIIFELLDR